MKTIGLLGGMSWESTLEYYRIINTEIQKSLGGHHSGKILLYSVDFDDIKNLQFEGKWKEAGEKLGGYAQILERSGADIILIATNTMHKVYEEVASSVQIPIMHIADGTGKKIQESGYKKVGLLGTRFTMEQDFYKQRLEEKYGLSILIPDSEDRGTIHSIIYDELCLGVINESSRKKYENIIEKLKSHGAECIILGCTEIGMLIQENNSPLPVFDTTYIHAKSAVEYALT